MHKTSSKEAARGHRDKWFPSCFCIPYFLTWFSKLPPDWRISYWYLLCWKVLWPQQQNFISFILHFKINSLLILSCWKFRSKAKEVKLLEMLFPSLWLVAKCYFCKYLNYFGKKSEGYLTFALIFNNTSEYTIRLICFQILVSSMGFRMIS